jgi:hypothetical protein
MHFQKLIATSFFSPEENIDNPPEEIYEAPSIYDRGTENKQCNYEVTLSLNPMPYCGFRSILLTLNYSIVH